MKLLEITLIGIILCGGITPADHESMTDASKLHRLCLVPLLFRPDEAELFNGLLRPSDMIAVYAGHADLLELVDGPKRLLVAPSLARLELSLSRLEGTHVDVINYNPERYVGHNTPLDELSNLAGTLEGMRTICDLNGSRLCITPDKAIVQEEGSELAPLVDLFGIQVQRYQRKSSEEFRVIVSELVTKVRTGRPGLPVFIQLSMAPPVWNGDRLVRDANGRKMHEPVTAEQVIARMLAVTHLIDGVALLYTQESLVETLRLIRLLRT